MQPLCVYICVTLVTRTYLCEILFKGAIALHFNYCFLLPACAALAGILSGYAAETREPELYNPSVQTLCSSSSSARPAACVIQCSPEYINGR